MAKTILQAVEKGAQVLLASSSLSASVDHIYRGITNENKEAPCVIVVAESATEEIAQTGVWNVSLKVIAKEMAYEGDEENTTFADEAFAIILDPLVSMGSYTSGLTVIDILIESNSETQENDAWVSTLQLRVVCSNS